MVGTYVIILSIEGVHMYQASNLRKTSSLGIKFAKAARNPIMAIHALYVHAIREPWRYLLAYRFDKKHKIDTRQKVEKAFLHPKDQHSLQHGFHYAPVPLKILRLLIGKLKDEPSETCFIDIGCGKGLACFYASRKFKNVIGIDFSESLIRQANVNLQSFLARENSSIKFETSDARSYRLPDKRCIVYLYNPFDEHILREFIRNNLLQFAKHQSRIVYVNDQCKHVLHEFGFAEIYRNRTHKISFYALIAQEEMEQCSASQGLAPSVKFDRLK